MKPSNPMNVLRPCANVLATLGALFALSGPVFGAPQASPDALTDGDELAPFFEAAATCRVDVVGIGDSNQLRDSNGWDDGWIRALDTRFGTYATSLLSIGENNGNGGLAGSGFRILSSGSTFEYTGGPVTEAQRLAVVPGFGPLRSVWVPEAQQVQLTNHGLGLFTDAPINVNAHLLFSTTYAVTQSLTPATIRPYVRRIDSPYNTIAEASAPLPTTGPMPSVERTFLEIPAAQRDHGLQVMLGRFNSTLSGPFVGYYMRLEEPDIQVGVSYTTLYGVGGSSLRDMARALLDLPTETLTLFFGTLREDQIHAQGGQARVLVRINSGLNDRNETELPVNGSQVGGDTPFAYNSNCRSIIERIQGVWALNGWPDDELYFLITPSHPTGPDGSNPVGLNNDDLLLTQYRDQARSVALSLPRCAALDLNQITTEVELAANFWYRSNLFDRSHLRVTGYAALSERELAALQNGRSWYDADADGAIAPEDLYTVAQWGGTPPAGAPADLSETGIRRAIRFQENGEMLEGR